jgi:two-component system, OmpR family, KDP operon response regulator KdpE
MNNLINPPEKKPMILAVDDNIHILQMIQRILENEDYEVSTAESGEAALRIFNEVNPSLVLLDLLLPDMDGFEVCRYIRQFSRVPIIMVTAKGTVDERVDGLNIGADDYIGKPFSSKELVARISAAIRRGNFQKHPIPDPILKCRDMNIDLVKKIVTIRGEIINLSATEYHILSFLALNSDRIVAPEEIVNEVWGEDCHKDAHILQVNIRRLRIKLKEDEKDSPYIETKASLGYFMKCRSIRRKNEADDEIKQTSG